MKTLSSLGAVLAASALISLLAGCESDNTDKSTQKSGHHHKHKTDPDATSQTDSSTSSGSGAFDGPASFGRGSGSPRY